MLNIYFELLIWYVCFDSTFFQIESNLSFFIEGEDIKYLQTKLKKKTQTQLSVYVQKDHEQTGSVQNSSLWAECSWNFLD